MYSQFLYSEIALAPHMIGTAIMNVKSAAARWLIPASTPPEIVEPERENPGQIDKHWIKPTTKACP
ncbi:hypothetical protein D3C77_711800 [compost metagenome]